LLILNSTLQLKGEFKYLDNLLKIRYYKYGDNMKYTKGTKAIETRKMILTKANEIFENHGPNKYTLNQLIEEIGVTKGKFYYHFNSMFELVYEVLISGNLQVENYYDEIKDTMDPPSLLSAIVTYMFIGTEAKINNKQFAIYLASMLKGTSNMSFSDELVVSKVYKDILKRGVDGGYFRDDIPLDNLLMSMFPMTLGLLFTWGHSENGFILSSHVEATTKLIVDSLKKK